MSEIDWQSYYRRFSSVHGSEPVELRKGVLLFPDGWQYVPRERREIPPDNPALRRQYWAIRRDILRAEYVALRERIRSFLDLQSRCSVPIQVADSDPEHGTTVGDVDFPLLLTRLRTLFDQVETCDGMLSSDFPGDSPEVFRPPEILAEYRSQLEGFPE